MTIAVVIILAPVALAVYAAIARAVRGRRGPTRDLRLERIDERRAVAHLYGTEHRLEVSPQHPPNP